MIRRLYITWMRLRKKHVLAADCWCHPIRENYR